MGPLTNMMIKQPVDSFDSTNRSTLALKNRAVFVFTPLILVGWVSNLVGIVAYPYLTHSPSLDDDLTRNTARLALAGYAIAVNQLLLLGADDWKNSSRR